MVRSLGRFLDRFFARVTPEPFVLAVLLTLVCAALALLLTPAGPTDIIDAWAGPRGLFALLGFAMQMCLVLVTGHALASAPVVRRGLGLVVDVPRTGAQAAALVAFFAVAASLLNWGLGLIVGAVLAKEVGRSAARRGVAAHYPLLAAAGYTGLMTWHGGLSGSAPLKVTQRKDLIELLGPQLGEKFPTISLYETTFSRLNLVVTLGLLLLVPLMAYALAPRAKEPQVGADRILAPDPVEPPAALPRTFPERLYASPLVMLLLAAPLVWAAARFFGTVGIGGLDPNTLNLCLLAVGLLLHRTLQSYAAAVDKAVVGCAGIILQFPLYAGIMGIMTGTGLAKVFATWAAGAGSTKAYLVSTFLSAALINLFVPSGGGQWAVQGPIALEAAGIAGAPLGEAVLMVAYGDQWTNMLQPFWALPLLGITGVAAKDIIGYTATIMLLSGAWILGAVLLLG